MATVKGTGGAGVSAHRRMEAVFALLVLVTGGWMTGIALGVWQSRAADAGTAADIGAWLTPALQGVLTLAIVSIAVALTAVAAGVRRRAAVMSDALPRLLDIGKDRA
ncbi:MAG: hypothetical protein AB7V42_10755 [Thermoleophilia bacterium]